MKNDLRDIIEYSVYKQINSTFKSNVYEVVRKVAKLPVTEAVGKSLATIVWNTAWRSVNWHMREKLK